MKHVKTTPPLPLLAAISYIILNKCMYSCDGYSFLDGQLSYLHAKQNKTILIMCGKSLEEMNQY